MPKRNLHGEDLVANKFAAIRAGAKLPLLDRTNPSVQELELVCTAALTGKRVGDPVFAGLETYKTDDLSADAPALNALAIGTAVCAKGESCDKKWPRYSVIVEQNPNLEKPSYTVGVARRPSELLEFFAPLFSDVPFRGMNDWKKKVSPECRNAGHDNAP